MTTYYHGSNIPISKFTDEFVGRGNDQYGPGIYFAETPEVARHYGKYVYEVEIDTNAMRMARTNGGTLSETKVEKLIQKAPDLEDSLMDWAEDPDVAFTQATEAMLIGESTWDILQNIWYDFYREEPVQFVREVVKIGFHAALAETGAGTHFLVLLDPRKIKSMVRIDDA